jgi:hypothetical protein
MIGFCDVCGTRIPNWLSHRDMPAKAKEKIPFWPDDIEISQVLPIGQGELF